ncbi:MAG: arginyltransferase [Campylobacteraceae bacterium]|jgi:arginine-tRNA-protein transferase|nr:arginyltransferase [Campylobacteraceae bacterium]
MEEPQIVEFSTLPHACSYLKDKICTMHYKYILNCPFLLNSILVERGWRRFGLYFSRPNCKECKECINLRIDVKNFKFSHSARRIFKRNQDTKMTICEPSLTHKHLELYAKYHKFMSDKKGWKYYELTPKSYFELHVAGCGKFGKEVLYFYKDKMIAVDLIDFTDNGISSIYFFYDPDFSRLSLGKYSIYQQILLAQAQGLDWIYLGYYVKECPSLMYKAEYRPHQLLQGNPEIEEMSTWI